MFATTIASVLVAVSTIRCSSSSSRGADLSSTTSIKSATLCRLARSLDSFGFNDVARVPQARRVDQRHPQSLDVDRLRHQVPRRSRHVRDNGARRPRQRVEQTRFADVRRSDDRDLQSFANEPPSSPFRKQCGRPLDQRVERLASACRGSAK